MSGALLVTDAPHLLYRAFFALPDSIKGADGQPVNALLGSVNQTLWCIERYKPRAVVMCFGQESADYRVEAFPPYHASRPPMPEELAHQWALAPGLYEALGWSAADAADLEADDLLGSLAAVEAAAGGTIGLADDAGDLGEGVEGLQRGDGDGGGSEEEGAHRGALAAPSRDREWCHRERRRRGRSASVSVPGSAQQRKPVS